MVCWDGEHGWGEANKFTHFWVFSGGLSTGEVRGTHVALLSPCMDTAPIHHQEQWESTQPLHWDYLTLLVWVSSPTGIYMIFVRSLIIHLMNIYEAFCVADSGPHPWSSKTVVKRKRKSGQPNRNGTGSLETDIWMENFIKTFLLLDKQLMISYLWIGVVRWGLLYLPQKVLKSVK